MKKNTLLNIGLLAGAYLLFSSFKNKPNLSGSVLVKQVDAPTGTQTVYSKVGTKLFDKNGNTVCIYDTAGLGMTVTGFNNGVYSVVYGDSFEYGLPAYVNATDVTTN
jgi:hypothetical protein